MKTVKTIQKTLTADEWESISLKYHRGDRQQAIGAAAKESRKTNHPYYVYASYYGFKVTATKPVLPAKGRYYEITVDGDTVNGTLFEY